MGQKDQYVCRNTSDLEHISVSKYKSVRKVLNVWRDPLTIHHRKVKVRQPFKAALIIAYYIFGKADF